MSNAVAAAGSCVTPAIVAMAVSVQRCNKRGSKWGNIPIELVKIKSTIKKDRFK